MMTTAKAKTALRLAASVLLLVCLITFCPMTAARAAEPEPVGDAEPAAEATLFPGACSVTVYPVDPASQMAEDLATVGLTVDVYRVADALADPIFDAYSYRFVDDFAALSVGESMDVGAWSALAQQAAAIVRDAASAPLATGASGEGTRLPGEGESLTAGLYLLIAHGGDMGAEDDVFRSIEDPDTGASSIVSTAISQSFVYSFAPQLVSLPGKGDLTGSVTNSADPGEWQEHVTVYLKPTREDRMVDLTIVKTLTDFVGTQDASFVFSITATKEIDGELKTVFSRVVMMTFSAAGTKTLTIPEAIPVGAQVTVTEVYDGPSYTLVSQSEVPVIASADAPPELSFVNSPDHFRPGEGVINRFTHDASGDWAWQQITDESDGSGEG